MRRIIAISVALSMLLAGNALADWQYTRWGMTPAEVAKAPGGRAAPYVGAGENTDTEVAKLLAPYSAGEYAFTAYFMFSRTTDRLSSVRLNLADPGRCQSVYSDLLAKYGQALKDSWSGALKVSTWQDRPNNTRVQIVGIGQTSCTVIYSPLASESNKGL
jgi:hypothetical protein